MALRRREAEYRGRGLLLRLGHRCVPNERRGHVGRLSAAACPPNSASDHVHEPPAPDPAGRLSACLSSHSTSGGSSPSASPLMPPTSRLFPPPFSPPSFSSAFAHLPPSPASSSASSPPAMAPPAPNHTCLRRTTSRSFISTTTTTTTTTVLGGGHHAGLASPRSSGTGAAAPDHEPDAANPHRRNRHLHRRSEDLSGIHAYSSFAAVQPQPRARSISSASQHPRILPLLSPRHPRDVRADDGALDAQTPAPTPQHHDDALPQPSSTATPSAARRRTPSRSAPSSRINLAKHFRHDDGTEASSSNSSSGSGVGGFFGLVRERVNHLQSLHDPYDQAAASASSPTNPSFLPLLRSTTPDPGGSRLPPDLLSSTTDVTSTPETQQALTLLPPTLSSYLLAPVVPLVQALTLVCISLLAFSAVSAVLAGSYGLTAYDRARARLKGVSLGLEGGRRLLERGVERGRKLVEGVVVGGTAGGGEAAATAKDGEDPALSSSSSSPRRHHRRWTTSSSSWSANLAWSSPPRPAATSSSSSPSYPPSPSFSQSAADYVRSALPGFFVADMGGGSSSSFSFREQPRRHFTQAQHQPQQPYPSRRAFTAPPSSTASSRAHSPTRFSPSSSSSFPSNSSSSSGAASSSSAPHYPPKPNGLPPRPPLSLLVPSILFTLFVSACAIGVAVVKAWRGELDAQRRGAREKEKPTAEAGTSTGSGRRRPTMTTAEKRRGW